MFSLTVKGLLVKILSIFLLEDFLLSSLLKSPSVISPIINLFFVTTIIPRFFWFIIFKTLLKFVLKLTTGIFDPVTMISFANSSDLPIFPPG